MGENREYSNKNSYYNYLATGICKKGFTGIVCLACETNYGKISDGNCIKCSNIPIFEYFKIVFLLILRISLALKSIYSGINSSYLIATNNEDKIRSIKSCLLKILLLEYFQILSSILYFPIIQNLGVLNFFSQFIEASAQDSVEIFSFECLYKEKNIKIKIPYLKVISVWVYSIFLLVLALMFFLSKKYKINNVNCNPLLIKKKSIITAIFAIVIIMCLPNIIKQIFTIFSCIIYEDNIFSASVLLYDYSINCNEKNHLNWIKYFGSFSIILSIFILPIFIFYKITKIKIKNLLNDPIVIFTYGYVYKMYKLNCFYWDFINFFKRIIISIIILVFYNQIKNSQIFPILIIFLILFFGLFLQIKFEPYAVKYNDLNKFSSEILKCLIITYFLLILSIASNCNKSNSILLILSSFFLDF